MSFLLLTLYFLIGIVIDASLQMPLLLSIVSASFFWEALWYMKDGGWGILSGLFFAFCGLFITAIAASAFGHPVAIMITIFVFPSFLLLLVSRSSKQKTQEEINKDVWDQLYDKYEVPQENRVY